MAHLYDSLIIVKSVLVYIMGPNAVTIHRSLPDSFKCLAARHQGSEISTRCNLEMSLADLAVDACGLFHGSRPGGYMKILIRSRLLLYSVTP